MCSKFKGFCLRVLHSDGDGAVIRIIHNVNTDNNTIKPTRLLFTI